MIPTFRWQWSDLKHTAWTQKWAARKANDWPRGVWTDEADRVQWTDCTAGYDCLVIRDASVGYLSGYVRVPPEHFLYGEVGDLDSFEGIVVHNGISYNDFNTSAGKHASDFVRCHDKWIMGSSGFPELGNTVVGNHWIGFRCANLLHDLAPITDILNRRFEGSYKDIEFVMRECNSVAQQLHTANVLWRNNYERGIQPELDLEAKVYRKRRSVRTITPKSGERTLLDL